MLHRTQSAEPQKSPFLPNINMPTLNVDKMNQIDLNSRTPSRLESALETSSRSDVFSFDGIPLHIRNDSRQSQDSATTYRSDISTSRASASQESSSIIYDPYHMSVRRGSITESITPVPSNGEQIDRNVERKHELGYAYESHSLPRRSCMHQQHHLHAMSRRDNYQNVRQYPQHIPEDFPINGYPVRSVSATSQHRRASAFISSQSGLPERMQGPQRRRSFTDGHFEPQTLHARKAQTTIAYEDDEEKQDEECSTCSSSDEGEDEQEPDGPDEKEIIIDFKPRISPMSSSRGKKKLIKTQSDGEILVEKQRTERPAPFSASDEHLKTPSYLTSDNFEYSSVPIQDENVFKREVLFKSLPVEKPSKESFRKRSISLEEAVNLEMESIDTCQPMLGSKQLVFKSAPSTPSPEELPDAKSYSIGASIDSLATENTRDHSDTNWNDSQATILV